MNAAAEQGTETDRENSGQMPLRANIHSRRGLFLNITIYLLPNIAPALGPVKKVRRAFTFVPGFLESDRERDGRSSPCLGAEMKPLFRGVFLSLERRKGNANTDRRWTAGSGGGEVDVCGNS